MSPKIRALTLKPLMLGVVLAFLATFALVPSANAGDLLSRSITVQIDDAGNAHFREVWKTNENRGTEKYISKNNLRAQQQITDFKVSENGSPFVEELYWDVNASRSEKAGKYGIHHAKDGAIELCWGIGEYGSHEYVIEYTITNFVEKLEDAQVIYWQFVNPGLSEPVQELKIQISSPKFTDETVSELYTFGFNGQSDFDPQNHSILIKSDSAITKKQYAVALARINPDTFDTQSARLTNYQKLKDLAFTGAKERKKTSSPVAVSLAVVVPIIIFGFWALLGIFIWVTTKRKRKFIRTHLDALPIKPEDFISSKVPDFNIEKIYGLATAADSDLNREIRQNLVSAYLMKWLLEKKVQPIDQGANWRGKNNYSIRIMPNAMEGITDHFERTTLTLVMNAANNDLLLEASELKNYVSSSAGNAVWENLIETLKKNSSKYLADRGWTETAKPSGGLTKLTRLNQQGAQEWANVIGFRNYLTTFTLIDEREMQEVGLWKYYLIYATLFSCADRVYQQLKSLIPNFDKLIQVNQNSTQVATRIGYNAYLGHTHASSSVSSSFTSRGGSSFSGGGGGASGSSFGGGTR